MSKLTVVPIKLLALILIAYFAQLVIPYSDSFPYKEILDNVNASPILKSFANFDGVQYIIIASQRYFTYNQAYFPAYPMLMRIIHYIFNIDYFYGGIFISNIGFAIGLYYFYKLLRIDFDKKKSFVAILFLMLFPTSFYFHVIYTEGLFFALFISFLYFLRSGKIKTALFISIFLSATKLIGVFSVIFLIPYIIKKYFVMEPVPRSFNVAGNPLKRGEAIPSKSNRTILHSNIFADRPGIATLPASNAASLVTTPLHAMRYAMQDKKFFGVLLIPFLGLFAYMFYLWQTTGDPLFFFNSQPAFGANRSTHIILLPQVYYRYFKMLFTAAFNWQYVIVFLEFISFTFVAIILSIQSYVIAKGLSLKQSHDKQDQFNFSLTLNIFSWLNILLPTLTGTFSSVPRYALFSLSIFYFFAYIKNKFLQYSLLTVFAILQIILFAFFIQGYFVA